MNINEQPQEHNTGLIDSAVSTPPKTPRWVKAFVIISIIVVVLVAVLLTSGGEHNPSRHMEPPGSAEVHPSSVEHREGQ